MVKLGGRAVHLLERRKVVILEQLPSHGNFNDGKMCMVSISLYDDGVSYNLWWVSLTPCSGSQNKMASKIAANNYMLKYLRNYT